MGKFQDLTGQKFGRLTVIKRAENSKTKQTRWLCKCDCGKTKIILSNSLKSGKTISCGCLHNDLLKQRLSKHQKTKTRLYKVWLRMKARCYNAKVKEYNLYGGRGIEVCNEWKNNYMSFYNWALSNGYDENAKYKECTIDRIDVNGNYEPSNCRWVNSTIQSKNKRINFLVTYKNETHCLKDWSEILNINYSVLHKRLKYLKWSVEKSFECKTNLNSGKGGSK